jgi:hypothetical protein
MRTEKQYFQQEDVTVTSTRFIVGPHTFAMANITSVKSMEVKPNTKPPFYTLLIGFFVAAYSFGNSKTLTGILGLIAIVYAVFLFWNLSSTYAVVLTTAGGEVKAYESKSRIFISEIVAAINLSIVERG